MTALLTKQMASIAGARTRTSIPLVASIASREFARASPRRPTLANARPRVASSSARAVARDRSVSGTSRAQASAARPCCMRVRSRLKYELTSPKFVVASAAFANRVVQRKMCICVTTKSGLRVGKPDMRVRQRGIDTKRGGILVHEERLIVRFLVEGAQHQRVGEDRPERASCERVFEIAYQLFNAPSIGQCHDGPDLVWSPSLLWPFGRARTGRSPIDASSTSTSSYASLISSVDAAANWPHRASRICRGVPASDSATR